MTITESVVAAALRAEDVEGLLALVGCLRTNMMPKRARSFPRYRHCRMGIGMRQKLSQFWL